MNILIATFSIILLACPAKQEVAFTKSNTVTKPSITKEESVIIYKKVPTKWVKITKKSN